MFADLVFSISYDINIESERARVCVGILKQRTLRKQLFVMRLEKNTIAF